MHRRSESICQLAGALAKAQSAMVNPEKSLTAMIRDDNRNGMQRSFRYASLARGLQIVREALGANEIAVVQTTVFDHGILQLSTALVHSSGQWIASDFPVCRLDDAAVPSRAGAALTYARRYSLFTLVGIAGDDDLDAPDLSIVDAGVASSGPSPPPDRALDDEQAAEVRDQRRPIRVEQSLSVTSSAVLLETLLGEIESLGSIGSAATWARSALRAKNRMTAEHAKEIEAAFEGKIGSLSAVRISGSDSVLIDAIIPEVTNVVSESNVVARDTRTLGRIKPVRHRDPEHLKLVTTQPCLICGRQPADAHHLRFAQPQAFGRKVSDEFTVPLCRRHHRELNRAGNELRWWRIKGIEPLSAAGKLWKATRTGRPFDEAATGPDVQSKKRSRKSRDPQAGANGTDQAGRILPAAG